MKKYFAGLVAVCFAVICFAFTSKDLGTGPSCTGDKYWFHVNTGSVKTLCNSITASDLVAVPDPNNNGIIETGELATAANLEFGQISDAPHGCPDTNDEVCALSFNANQITVVLSNGVYYFVPTNVTAYQCCIKRP